MCVCLFVCREWHAEISRGAEVVEDGFVKIWRLCDDDDLDFVLDFTGRGILLPTWHRL